MIADLGKSIGNTLQGLFNKPVTDDAIEQSIKEICVSLIRYNVNPKYVAQLREQLRERIAVQPLQSNANKAKVVQHAVFEALVALLNPVTKPYEIKHGRPNVVVFVGLQGCGKTTSICKYANFYKKSGFRTGIVCADTFRAGAYDQVKQNATRIGVPFYGSDDPDPICVARAGVAKFRKSDFELILVDTSGRHTQEEALFQEMRELVAAVKPDNIVFVMDAGIGQSAEEQASGFRDAVSVGGIILTKMDGAEKAGGALSSVAATGCPIEFVGMGEQMDDLERFNSRRFVSKMLGMGDLEGLMEAVSSIEIDEKELAQKMSEGKFKLADFKKIYGQLLSLGPLFKMLGMIPGMQNMQIPDESKFKQITHIFDSLSRKELNSNGDIFSKEPRRVRRVALGSGTTESAVSGVILNFKQMNNLMKKMMNNPMLAQMLGGGSGLGGLDDFINSMN